jgi:hypothetical protein
MYSLESTCCRPGKWHHHSRKEIHRHDGPCHLIVWESVGGGSYGWAVLYTGEHSAEFEGVARSIEEAKNKAEKAVSIYTEMLAQIASL